MFYILFIGIIILAWLDIIPLRYWYTKCKIIYEGKKTRLIIRLLKLIELLR